MKKLSKNSLRVKKAWRTRKKKMKANILKGDFSPPENEYNDADLTSLNNDEENENTYIFTASQLEVYLQGYRAGLLNAGLFD